MSSLQNTNFLGHVKQGIHPTPFTQKSDRDYYIDLFSQASDDTEYIAQHLAAQKLCTQGFNKNPELQEWHLTNDSTISSPEKYTANSTHTQKTKSYNQAKQDKPKGSLGINKQRDYYDELFSSDSDEDSTNSNNTGNMYTFDLSILSENLRDKTKTSKQNDNEPNTSSDMDISSTEKSQDSTTSIENSYQSQSIESNTHQKQKLNNSHLNSSSNSAKCNNAFTKEDETKSQHSEISIDSLDYLDEEEIIRLQRGTYIKQTLTNTKSAHLTNPEETINVQSDKIICHNIQNKYDHMAAAEMILKEQITFAALQEPSATGRHDNTAWNAFKKRELASARITSYETQHQVILYDAWRWGERNYPTSKAIKTED